jgi:two-component system LytT family response regulator
VISAIHIENDAKNIEYLAQLIKEYAGDQVTLMGNAGNISDAIQLIQEKQPQLIYLDTELGEGNAFELLEQLPNLNFQVIFITALHSYAAKAFRFNAIDYLLKPLDTQEFKAATQRAIDKIQQSDSGKQLVELLKHLRPEAPANRVGFPVSDGVTFVHLNEIVKIEAHGTSSIVYTADKKSFNTVKFLKELERLLPEKQFIRVHHSFIININFCKKYYRGKNSYMEMEDGSTVPISVRKKGDFLSTF